MVILTLRPRQNGRHFADVIFKCIFLNENVWKPFKISLKFVPQGPFEYIPALVQIMAWCRPGNKPLSEPMMVSLLTHICVTRPQWVKIPNLFIFNLLNILLQAWFYTKCIITPLLQNNLYQSWYNNFACGVSPRFKHILAEYVQYPTGFPDYVFIRLQGTHKFFENVQNEQEWMPSRANLMYWITRGIPAHAIVVVAATILQFSFTQNLLCFYPRPVLAFGYCHRPCLCICQCDCVSITCLSAR